MPLVHEISIQPRHFGPYLQKTIRNQLYEDVEGTCNGQYVWLPYAHQLHACAEPECFFFPTRCGFIVAVTGIDAISKGWISPARGEAMYTIK